MSESMAEIKEKLSLAQSMDELLLFRNEYAEDERKSVIDLSFKKGVG